MRGGGRGCAKQAGERTEGEGEGEVGIEGASEREGGGASEGGSEGGCRSAACTDTRECSVRSMGAVGLRWRTCASSSTWRNGWRPQNRLTASHEP